MTISMQYQTSEACDSVAGNLGSDILTQLRLLNDQHNRDLCQFEHGVDDVRCSQALVDVRCMEDNKADVTIILPWIRYVSYVWYHNDLKFSNGYPRANSADQDQTTPRLVRVFTVCKTFCIFSSPEPKAH